MMEDLNQELHDALVAANPLLNLLMRVGFRYNCMSDLPNYRKFICYQHPDERNPLVFVYEDGLWAYDEVYGVRNRYAHVKTEGELTDLLEGTAGGAYLRRYKLNLLLADG